MLPILNLKQIGCGKTFIVRTRMRLPRLRKKPPEFLHSRLSLMELFIVGNHGITSTIG